MTWRVLFTISYIFLFLDISLPGRGSIKGSVHHYTQRNPESKPESPKKAPQETLIPSSKA
jgi:hypothetical protein